MFKFYIAGMNDGKDRTEIYECYSEMPSKKELVAIKSRLIERNEDLNARCKMSDEEKMNVYFMYCLTRTTI